MEELINALQNGKIEKDVFQHQIEGYEKEIGVTKTLILEHEKFMRDSLNMLNFYIPL